MAHALQQRRELVKVELARPVGVGLIVQRAQPLAPAHLDAEAADDPPDLALVDEARAVLVKLVEEAPLRRRIERRLLAHDAELVVERLRVGLVGLLRVDPLDAPRRLAARRVQLLQQQPADRRPLAAVARAHLQLLVRLPRMHAALDDDWVAHGPVLAPRGERLLVRLAQVALEGGRATLALEAGRLVRRGQEPKRDLAAEVRMHERVEVVSVDRGHHRVDHVPRRLVWARVHGKQLVGTSQRSRNDGVTDRVIDQRCTHRIGTEADSWTGAAGEARRCAEGQAARQCRQDERTCSRSHYRRSRRCACQCEVMRSFAKVLVAEHTSELTD